MILYQKKCYLCGDKFVGKVEELKDLPYINMMMDVEMVNHVFEEHIGVKHGEKSKVVDGIL